MQVGSSNVLTARKKEICRPVDARAASVVLRRLRAARRIHLVRKGKGAQEALYRRGAKA